MRKPVLVSQSAACSAHESKAVLLYKYLCALSFVENRLRAAVLVVFAVVGGCSLFLVITRLQLADSVPNILPPGHNLQRVDYLLRSVFTSQLWSEIYVVWGVQGECQHPTAPAYYNSV